MISPGLPQKQTFTDARGFPVTLPLNPRRIISLIPSITETLFDFGLAEQVVGRTRFCIRPPGLVEKVKPVGGTKDPDIELIVSLEPDLVIANIEENEKEHIDELAKRGLAVFVTYPRTVADSLELLSTLAAITGTGEAAEFFVKNAGAAAVKVKDSAAAIKERTRIVYLIWWKPYMTVNRDTYIHDMITFCGGSNVFENLPGRYPAVSIEAIIEKAPDLIILPSEPFRFLEIHREELMQYKNIPAVRNNAVILTDGEMFSWFGTRMIYSLPYVLKLLTGKTI